MNKGGLILLIILILIVIGLIFFSENREDDEFVRVNMPNDKGDVMTEYPDAEVYVVDNSGSTLAWVGGKTFVKDWRHNGTVNISEGRVFVEDGTVVGGDFMIDMNTITNLDLEEEQNKQLVNHLKSSDWFDVENYPTARFVIIDVETLDGPNLEITGDLTIKGVTNQVSFEATVDLTDETATAKANFNIDRSEYGVKFGSLSFFSDLVDENVVGDEMEFSLDLVAVR
jgi:polyisoprenoid-binding protein YceI